MGHRAWMYVSSARVSGGRDGAVGREIAAATSRRDVASRSMATMTIPTRTSSPAAMTTSLRRETFEERVSADGIIASPVSLRCARNPYASPRQIRCQSGVNGKRGHWTDLSGRRLVGAQHSKPPAEIRVPDVVRAVDGDAERTGIGPWQTKFRHAAVAQPAQTPTPELAEPHGAVGRDGQSAEPDDGRGQGERSNAAVGRHAGDGAGGCVRVPDAAVGVDVETQRLEIWRLLGQALDSAVAVHAERIRHLYREPDRALQRDRDGRGDVPAPQHAVLDQSGVAPWPADEREDACDDHDARHRHPRVT